MKKKLTKLEKSFLETLHAKSLYFYIDLINKIKIKHREDLENKKIEYSGIFEYFIDKKGEYNITVYEEKAVIKD